MPLRKINLPSDIDQLIKNTLTSFTYPDHPEWDLKEDEKEEVLDQIKAIKRYWPLMVVLRLFFSGVRDILLGYVWEEEGQLAGNIAFQRRAGGAYYINSISVLPEFRRRGIARKLLTAVIEEAKNDGAKNVRLDVISANLPARSLYESLGFTSFRNFTILNINPDCEIPPASSLPPGIEEITLGNDEWRPVYDLNERILTEQVRLYDPPSPAVYQQSGFQSFLNSVMGSPSRKMVLKEVSSSQTLGYCKYTYRTRKGGLNHMLFQLDPGSPGLAACLIQSQFRRLAEISPGRRTEINIPDNQPDLLRAAVEIGFRKRQEFSRMGLLLQDYVSQN